jgi:hypothetical protein
MPLVTPPNGKLGDLARTLTSASDAELVDIAATRRGLILAPLLAALPAALLADPAHAVDPSETQITLPDQVQWKPWSAGGAAGAMKAPPCSAQSTRPGRTRFWCAGIPAT